jgi:flagellar biosynthetic protein FliP
MLRNYFKQPLVLASALLALVLLAFPLVSAAQGIPMLNVTGGAKGQQQYSLSLQLLALMTSLTLLPSFLLMMTAFVRIIIVLSILRQALGPGPPHPTPRWSACPCF